MKTMKGEEMVNRTPLRLVAIEEGPTEPNEQAGAPVEIMSAEDAVTRKVPESEMIASQETFRDEPKPSPGSRILLPAAAAAVVVILAVIALAIGKSSTATPAPAGATSAPVPSPRQPPQPLPSAAPAAPVEPSSPRTRPVPESIHLAITAEPIQTELSLDGHVLAAHRLDLEVPRDHGIHVIGASAPGYAPFNQQVSFTGDVVLRISLHAAYTPPVRQGARSRPSRLDSSSKINVRPAVAPPGPGLEPGMNLEGPSVRHYAKPIDERNPYKP